MTNEDILEQRAFLATNDPFVLEDDGDEDFFDAANLFEDEEDDE